ncbi:MAG: hypothetical protein IT473_07355 [Lysobacter sp.]|nr:hypothetical protein [Lysobacter sp.]
MNARALPHSVFFVRIAAATCVLALFVGSAYARKSGRDEGGRDEGGRERYYGIVRSMPEGRLGEWVIGSRRVVADRATEFDETEGRLAVGDCAKIDIRNGRVHEIDSEPASDCR